MGIFSKLVPWQTILLSLHNHLFELLLKRPRRYQEAPGKLIGMILEKAVFSFRNIAA